MRVGFAGAYGIDFPTFLRFGEMKGLQPDFLAELLPPIEDILLQSYRKPDSDD